MSPRPDLYCAGPVVILVLSCQRKVKTRKKGLNHPSAGSWHFRMVNSALHITSNFFAIGTVSCHLYTSATESQIVDSSEVLFDI